MSKTKNNRKIVNRPTLSVGNFVVTKKIKLFVYELSYILHIYVRKIHDLTYLKSKTYKSYSDHPISQSVHKATLTAFVLSFIVFYSLQYLAPLIMNPLKPGEVFAGTNSISWKTRGDFNTNTTKTGSLYITGNQDFDDANVSLVSELDPSKSKIAAGTRVNAAIKSDEKLISAGTSIGNATNWSSINSIDIYNNRILGLASSGTVMAEGVAEGSSTTSWTNVKAISVGLNFVTALTNTGTVLGAGINTNGQTNVGSWTGIKAISTGTLHTLGLKEDGTVVGVGYNTNQQINVSGWTGIKAIAAGGHASYGIKSDGTVVRTGSSLSETSTWSNIKQISASNTSHVVGLRNDGTVVAAGIDTHEECDEVDCWPVTDGRVSGVSSWTNIVAVAAGDTHTLGLKSDGTVVSVGWDYGQNNVSSWTGVQQPTYTYTSPASLSGLTASPSTRSNFKTVSFALNQALPTGAGLTPSVRVADSSSDLTSATFYNTTNVTPVPDINDPVCIGLSNSPTRACYTTTVVGAGGGLPSGLFAELKLTLTSTGQTTPTLDGISLSYDSLDSPVMSNMSISSVGSGTFSTGGVEGVWTKDNKVNFNVPVDLLTCVGCGASTNRRSQVEVKNTATAFGSTDNDYVEDGGIGDLDGTVNGSVQLVQTTQASPIVFAAGGAYHWRARSVDNEGRVSGWTSYGASSDNPTAAADFTIDQTPPTLTSISVNSGIAFTNNKLTNVTLTGASDAASGVSQMRFSNNGTDWSSWESYSATKSNWDLTANPTNTADGARIVYVQIKDNAGNISGKLTSSKADFETVGYTKESSIAINDNGTMNLTGPNDSIGMVASSEPSNSSGMNCLGGGDATDCHYTGNFAGANQVKVDWSELQGSSYYQIPSNGTITSISANGSSGWINGSSIYIYWTDTGAFFDPGANFTVSYRSTSLPASGTYTSPTLDMGNNNEASLISWQNVTKPGDSDVKFQVASKTLDSGWINGDYIGPDGTASTFYTTSTGQELSSHHVGKRYIRYKAILSSTSDRTQTSVLDSVTIESRAKSQQITLDTTAPTVSSNTITSPNGSETWKGGSTKTITWNNTSINDGSGSGLRTSTPPIKLEYTINGTDWNLIADNEANDGTYTWTVPTTLSSNPVNSTTVKVRATATDAVGNSVNDVSNANFTIDSSAPTGTVTNNLNQYYTAPTINVAYTAEDTANSLIETGRSGSLACWDNQLSGTIENLTASQVRVNYTATSSGSSFSNGGTYNVQVYSGASLVTSLNQSNGAYSNGTFSGSYGLAPGNKIVYSCDDFEVNEGISLNINADFAGSQTISGVKNVKLYYTRQTSANYTWTAYPNNSTPSTFTSTPISFDTAQIADAVKTGNYGFKLVVEDNAGNISATPGVGTAPDTTTYIDLNAPTGNLSINSGAIATNDPNNATLAFTLSDVGSGLASYQIDNNDGIWSTMTNISSQNSPYSATVTGWHLIPGDGLKTVRIKLLDKAGNEVTNITDTIAIDTTAPTSIDSVVVKNGDNLSETLSANGASQGWYPYSNLSIYLKAVDEQSGIKEFKYCIIKTNEACDFNANPTVAASQVGSTTSYEATKAITLLDARQGILTLHVKGVDFVGLESSEVTYVYKFDKILPGAIMNFSASKGTETTTVKLMWDDPFMSASTAPTQKYKVERILAEDYTPSLGYDGTWGGVSSYNEQILDVVDDAAVLVKVGNTFTFYDQTMQNSLKYLYRVSAKDYSNSSYGGYPVDDPEFVENGYGYTRDVAAPEVYPSSVVAVACNSNLDGGVCSGVNKKGHQVQVKWLPAVDSGAGVAGYEIFRREGGSADPNGWTKIEANFAETSDPLNAYRVYYDNTVSDAKSYSYRVVAFDSIPAQLGSPNKTDLFRGSDYTNLDNATTTTANVPDVTAPIIPANFAVTPLGIDYILDEAGSYHQKISSAWKQTADNNLLTNISYQLYFSPTNQLETFTVIDTQSSASFNAATQQESDRISYKFDQTGLADKTTYYYYLKVTDAAGNSASSSVKSATTGNSQAPTPPTGVEVHNDTAGMTDPGTQLIVKFRGSLARNCDEATKEDCIVSYQIYRADTNAPVDIDSSLTPADSTDNCNLNESPDDCWVRINNATLANTQTVNPPAANETLSAKRSILDTGLTQATRYFYRIRAIDNNTDGALMSPLSTVYEDQIHTGGWDITKDLTAPVLPTNGLEVKVKDTHPNTSVLRNIVSWKILDQTPLRKKQGYEATVANGGSCNLINSGGIDYCKDFGRYEIYRQILDVNNNIIFESNTPIATITDPETNLYIDSIGNNDLLEGIPGTPKIIDTKIRYYIQVVDNSYENFLYPDNSKINLAPNKTEKQYSTDTIIPSKATPSVVGSVTLSEVAVTSAVVSWNTDQDTDSLVQYRVSGSNSDWVTVGQVERNTVHTVKVFGLLPNTTYEYKLVSRNYLDNRATYDNSQLPILKTGGFNIITDSVISSTTTTGVEISWRTNLDASSSFVEYQMQTQPGDEPQGKTVGVNPDDIAARPKDHKVVFNGLKSDRTYTYKIKSISKDGFVAETGFLTFITKSFDTSQFTITPSSSNVAEKNITSTTALIAWSTGVPTTSWVDYSSDHITKENPSIKSSGNNDLNTQHAVQLEGLIPGTKYYYVVRSKNANDIEFTSPEYTFTAILKPKILDFKIMEVKPYSVTIAWTTNVDTETIVNWGKTTAYGEKRGKNEQTQNHVLTIDQLEDNTEYHMQIVAHDETGTEVVDADKNIKTPLDTQGPKIESVKTDILPMGASDETGSVIISWNTDKPATTMVEYDEGIIAGKYNMSSIEDKTLNLSHTVIIKNLKPASSYHYRIVSKDKRNNNTISQDYTFVTPSKEKSILQLILKSLEETFSWTKNMNKFFGNVGKRVTGK